MRPLNRKNINDRNGQIMVEFTFRMIVALVMLFSVMMIFRWSGFDLGWRRVDHDIKMLNVVTEDFRVGPCLQASIAPPIPGVTLSPCARYQSIDGPIEQVDPYFHKPVRMNAAWGL